MRREFREGSGEVVAFAKLLEVLRWSFAEPAFLTFLATRFEV